MARWLRFGALLVGLSVAIPAHAAPIVWQLAGVVGLIDTSPPLGGVAGLAPALTSLGVELGAPVSGFLEFESSTPDSDADPQYGHYAGAIGATELTIGSWSLDQGIFVPFPNQTIADIYVAHVDGSPSAYALQTPTDMFDPTQSYTYSLLAALELSTQDPAVIPNDALPIDPPSLSLLDPFGLDASSAYGYGTDLLIIGSEQGDVGRRLVLRVELTSLERVAEPSALPLLAFAAGLAALAMRSAAGPARPA